MRVGVTGKLKIGDKILIENPLMSRETVVTAIDGNKAKTDFRIFHVDIYHNRFIYEHGKRLHPLYNNTYTVIK